jgi:hypothetical protein
VDAIRLCRDDRYQRVARDGLEASLASAARRDRANLCAFVQRSSLTPVSLSSLDDRGLVQLLCDALRGGELTVLRECAAASNSAGDSLLAQRRLVVAIQKASRHPLSLDGRKYVLIAAADLAGMANRGGFEVVGRREALLVLDGLARAEHGLASLLAEARELLTKDWRPPLSPDGLILIKAVIQRQFVEAPADAEGWRPSRPKKSVFNPSGAPEPEEPETDPARQATTLVNASRDGVPFCEECVRAGTAARS